MTVQTLRPNATHSLDGTVSVNLFWLGGATTAHGAWGDQNNSTGLQHYAFYGATVDMETFTLPAGAVCKEIRPRWYGSGVAGTKLRAIINSVGAPTYTGSYPVSGDPSAAPSAWRSHAWSPTTSFTQSTIDGLRVEVDAFVNSHDTYEVEIELRYITAPLAPTAPGPAGTLNTLTPTYTWLHNGDADGAQYAREVKVFTDAVVQGGGFDPDTSQSVLEDLRDSTASSYAPTNELTNGVDYHIYVRTAEKTSGVYQWSPWASQAFDIDIDPTVPTNVVPTNTSTVTTALPALDSTGGTGNPATPRIKRQWQIASDTIFTQDVQLLDEWKYAHSHASRPVVPLALTALAQGVWYVRARFVDEDAVQGSWSAYNSFTVAHVPTALVTWPTGGFSIEYTTTPTVDWSFSDQWSLDAQTAYQVEFWKASDKPGTLIDTGKVTSGATQHQITGLDATWKDTEIRWRARVYDVDDVVSAWSLEAEFMLRDLPTCTIDDPLDSATITTSTPTIEWTFSASDGRTQVGYQVLIWDTDANPDQLVADSGYVADEFIREWTVPSPTILLSTNYDVQVTLTDSVQMAGSDTNSFDASYPVVTVPTYVITAYEDEARVYIDWSSSTVDGDNTGWRVFRRLDGATEWTMIYDGAHVAGVKEYNDYTCPSTLPVEYSVVQVIDSFGDEVESSYPITDFTFDVPKYWLVVPGDPDLNLQLTHVIGESFGDEEEMGVLNVIGKGRHVQYGTSFGQSGSCEVSFLDQPGITAREQRLAMESIRSSGLPFYLRNPFGDVWKVALPAANVTRISGVGLRELANATIEYIEVAND